MCSVYVYIIVIERIIYTRRRSIRIKKMQSTLCYLRYWMWNKGIDFEKVTNIVFNHIIVG